MYESPLPVSRFAVDADTCIHCGMCEKECVAFIIRMNNGLPAVSPEYDERCIGCQHCLAVCPVGAIRVRGIEPEQVRPLGRHDAETLGNLIRGRRSVRHFSGPVAADLLKHVLEVASYAPTGVNARARRFTVVTATEALHEFRRRVVELVLAKGERVFPGELQWMVASAARFEEKGDDILFRGAPQLILATAAPDTACKPEDCLIALSYFDLYAQANGIGTVWCGMVHYILTFFPESRKWLGIPDDHSLGYAMLFGMAGVRYAREALYEAEDVVLLDTLPE